MQKFWVQIKGVPTNSFKVGVIIFRNYIGNLLGIKKPVNYIQAAS